eukprot:TRINITY_DN22780_c0_g2_i1.p1 TRINITY_DN22780_c0_g2~~TRINITY_DN22780_c0_g2_i1.p1  ORF type:complete len:1631 (+),score=387.44 TRINITY_DN22780_c0_g2_i1:47-4939(+)
MSFQRGQLVEYFSGSKQAWFPGVVEDVDSNGGVKLNITPSHIPAAALPGKVRAVAPPATDKFVQGASVEYYSGSQGKWLPAVIADVRSDGAVRLNLGPAYLSADALKTKLKLASPPAASLGAPQSGYPDDRLAAVELPEVSEKDMELLKRKNALLNVIGNKGSQIVVVGDTSVGKSTTINFILGFPVCPENAKIGTRRPCIICQEYDPNADDITFEVRFNRFPSGSTIRPCVDVETVYQHVDDTNNPNKKEYFACATPDIREDQLFDDEPVYVTMRHVSFTHCLRLVDLPGLTSNCNRPEQIARQYIKPDKRDAHGNVVVLVMGKGNAKSLQWFHLAEMMARCSKVLVMQNFVAQSVDDISNNLEEIEKTFVEHGNSELASQLKIFCADYGRSKKSATWEPGDQQDWLQLSKEKNAGELTNIMRNHASRKSEALKNLRGLDVGARIRVGLQEPLKQLIEYQLRSLASEVDSLTNRARAEMATCQRDSAMLQERLYQLQSQSLWNAMLASVASHVSNFLESTVDITSIAMEYGSTSQAEWDNLLKTDKSGKVGNQFFWTGAKNVDQEVLNVLKQSSLNQHSSFAMSTKLLGLSSWLRLVDEFTAMLAFTPMKKIKNSTWRNKVGAVGGGMAATVNVADVIVECVVHENSSEDSAPIRRQLLLFKDRMIELLKRDLRLALESVGKDQSNPQELFELMGITDPGKMQEKRDALIGDMQQALIDSSIRLVEHTIGLQNDVPGDEYEGEIAPRRLADVCQEADRQGTVEWLLPFQKQFFNGQMPWKSIQWKKEDGDDAPPVEPAEEPAVEEAPADSMKWDSELLPDKGADLFANSKVALNASIYRLQTTRHDLNLKHSQDTESYELDAIRLLKAMQAQVASFWSTGKLDLIHTLYSEKAMRTHFMHMLDRSTSQLGATIDRDNASRMADEICANLAYLFEKTGGNEPQTLMEELGFAEERLKEEDANASLWNGGMSTSQYQECLRRAAEVDNVDQMRMPGNYVEKLAHSRSWDRVMDEFLFFVLQLPMRGVTKEEKELCWASTGTSSLASPQEVVEKLVMHRLKELGSRGGLQVKARMQQAWARDVGAALEYSKLQPLIEKLAHATEDLVANDEYKGAGLVDSCKSMIKDFMDDFLVHALKKVLDGLETTFDSLCPFDWSTLNGRLPLAELEDTGVPVKAADCYDASLLKELTVERISQGDKKSGETQVQCSAVLLLQSFHNLVGDKLSTLAAEASEQANRSPPDDNLAHPAVQALCLKVWKAMHCHAIDHCRPRLKRMLALIYERENILKMLMDAPGEKLKFTEMFKDVIEQNSMSLREMKAKIQSMEKVLSGEAVKQEISPEMEAEMKLKKAQKAAAEAAQEAQVANAKLDARMKSMARVKMQKNSLEVDADHFKTIGKKYFAMDNLLATNQLQLRRLEVSGCSGKVYVSCVVWWQKLEGWWGENVKDKMKREVSHRMLNHQFICRTSEKTLDAKSWVEFSDSSLQDGCDVSEDIGETFIPKLFPIHEHVLMIDCYRTIKHYVPLVHGPEKDEKVFSCCLPLAYALKDETKWWDMLENFDFQQAGDLPFALTVDGSARTFVFSKKIPDSIRFNASCSDKGRDYFKDVELTVEIGKLRDSLDSPIIDAQAEKFK